VNYQLNLSNIIEVSIQYTEQYKNEATRNGISHSDPEILLKQNDKNKMFNIAHTMCSTIFLLNDFNKVFIIY